MGLLNGILPSKTEKLYWLKHTKITVKVFSMIHVREWKLIALPIGTNHLQSLNVQYFFMRARSRSFFCIFCLLILFLFVEKNRQIDITVSFLLSRDCHCTTADKRGLAAAIALQCSQHVHKKKKLRKIHPSCHTHNQ